MVVPTMKLNWKLLKQIAGGLLIVIGFAALLTPLTPGAWLIFVGANMLGISFLSRKRMRDHYEAVKEWWKKRHTEEV